MPLEARLQPRPPSSERGRTTWPNVDAGSRKEGEKRPPEAVEVAQAQRPPELGVAILLVRNSGWLFASLGDRRRRRSIVTREQAALSFASISSSSKPTLLPSLATTAGRDQERQLVADDTAKAHPSFMVEPLSLHPPPEKRSRRP